MPDSFLFSFFFAFPCSFFYCPTHLVTEKTLLSLSLQDCLLYVSQSTSGELSMCWLAEDAPHEHSSTTRLWGLPEYDMATIYPCVSTALNSFNVVRVAFTGYGNLSFVWHRFRCGCHFFHVTWTWSANYILYMPSPFHFPKHLNDPSPASLYCHWQYNTKRCSTMGE